MRGFQANIPKQGPPRNALEHSQNKEKRHWLRRNYARVVVEVGILTCLPCTASLPGKPGDQSPLRRATESASFKVPLGSQPKRGRAQRQEEPAESGAPQALRSSRFHKTARRIDQNLLRARSSFCCNLTWRETHDRQTAVDSGTWMISGRCTQTPPPQVSPQPPKDS